MRNIPHNRTMQNIFTPQWSEYELIDSGNGRKLERFGSVIVDRVETQAIWRPSQTPAVWQKADAVFHKTGDKHGEWQVRISLPTPWKVTWNGVQLVLRLTPFGHVGIFPEQAVQWEWMTKKIRDAARPVKVLSLFSYTGAATLAAAAAGAEVVHVDASKPAITWARENQNVSGLADKKIRWIPDDAAKFVQREIRRGNRYDAIVMDPPKYGRGTSGEVWQFETAIAQLLADCQKLLAEDAIFLLVNAYAVPISPITLQNLVSDVMPKTRGTIAAGELGLQETRSQRVLPTAIFARWESGKAIA